jgi:hypothetical protein
MRMTLVTDNLLVEMVHMDFLLAMGRAQQFNKLALKLSRILVDCGFGIFADQQHLADVRFALDMAFEAVFVAAGFFTWLAIPS